MRHRCTSLFIWSVCPYSFSSCASVLSMPPPLILANLTHQRFSRVPFPVGFHQSHFVSPHVLKSSRNVPCSTPRILYTKFQSFLVPPNPLRGTNVSSGTAGGLRTDPYLLTFSPLFPSCLFPFPPGPRLDMF